MKEVKAPKRPLIYYYCIVLLIIILFNMLVTPLLSNNQVVKVDYGTFMDMIEEQDIGVVQVEDSQILFTDKEGSLIYQTTIVNEADLEESIEVVIAGYQKKNAILSNSEKLVVAYHEIGHALVAAKQTNSAPVQKITIIPRTSGALGYTMQVDTGDKYLLTKEELENKIATYTGGRAAEEIQFGRITTGASNDIEQATKLARAMITRYGMSEDFDMVAMETVNNQYLGGDASLTCSPDTQKEIDRKVVELVKQQLEKAKKILEDNKDRLAIPHLHEKAAGVYQIVLLGLALPDDFGGHLLDRSSGFHFISTLPSQSVTMKRKCSLPEPLRPAPPVPRPSPTAASRPWAGNYRRYSGLYLPPCRFAGYRCCHPQ